MDEGPFRMQSAPDRRGAGRPAAQPAARQPEPVQQPVAAEPRAAVKQAAASQGPQKKSPKGLKWLFVLSAVAMVAAAGWVLWLNSQNAAPEIKADAYQAVFFSNGNVYFGNLKDINSDYYKMSGVYYPQTQTTSDTEGEGPQQPADQSSITLLKLGDAIHGPEDEMMISKNQVLFYQNLRADSKVSQLIDGQK